MMTMQSPLGALRLLARVDELVGVYLPGQLPGQSDQPAPDAAPVERPTRVLGAAAEQIAEFFAGERQEFDLALHPVGTNFQQLVWRALTRIPYGETWTYGQLARAIGRPSASRAVGFANSKNPLSIIVPCHRVIGASGELTGYAGGMPAKRWLLDHERAHSICMQCPQAPSGHLAVLGDRDGAALLAREQTRDLRGALPARPTTPTTASQRMRPG